MSTFFPHQLPHPPDLDQDAEQQERLWQHYCTVAKRLDVGELITAVCTQLRGESGDTPLSDLLETWVQMPQWDWQHPLVAPSTCESLGRYVAGVAAAVVEQAIAQALQRTQED
jgi:hypothetical protein